MYKTNYKNTINTLNGDVVVRVGDVFKIKNAASTAINNILLAIVVGIKQDVVTFSCLCMSSAHNIYITSIQNDGVSISYRKTTYFIKNNELLSAFKSIGEGHEVSIDILASDNTTLRIGVYSYMFIYRADDEILLSVIYKKSMPDIREWPRCSIFDWISSHLRLSAQQVDGLLDIEDKSEIIDLAQKMYTHKCRSFDNISNNKIEKSGGKVEGLQSINSYGTYTISFNNTNSIGISGYGQSGAYYMQNTQNTYNYHDLVQEMKQAREQQKHNNIIGTFEEDGVFSYPHVDDVRSAQNYTVNCGVADLFDTNKPNASALFESPPNVIIRYVPLIKNNNVIYCISSLREYHTSVDSIVQLYTDDICIIPFPDNTRCIHIKNIIRSENSHEPR